MSAPRLSTIQITNFRSIRGTVSIPLDAPVVLLHGTNGAGKSTVMSALELGLTGRVSDIAESDRNHLVHQGEPGATIELVSSGGAHTLHLVGGRLSGNPLLGPDDSRFFGERCYLQQRTLTRLLEMYESESGKGESRLTRFVNDLLGLDELEALLSGMHPVTHRARLRRLVPELTVLETERDTFKAELQQLREREQELAISRSAPATQLRETLRALGAPGDIEDIEDFLSQTSRQDELIDLAAQRREVIAMQRHAEAVGGGSAGKELAARSVAAQKAREVATEWRHTHGRALEAVLEGLRHRFPGLPDAGTAQDPAAVRGAALGEVEAALKHLRDTLAVDASARADLAQLDAAAAEAQTRLAAIEAQLAASNPAAETEQLATALAALIPHIHGDDCPVCGRAFQEVSAEPLVAHLSMRVSELSERAQRLSLLAKAHLEAANDARRLSDQREALQAHLLVQDVRLSAEAELVFFEEAHTRLVNLQDGVAAGAEIMRSLSTAERALVQAEEKARGFAVLVSSVREFAATSSRVRVDAERIEETLRAIADELADRITAAEHVERLRRNAWDQLRLMRGQTEDESQLQRRIAEVEASLRHRYQRLAAMEERRDGLWNLQRDAEAARTEIVRRVFNDALNAVWRDLFVRLAPEEDFVPSFRTPDANQRKVVAELVTTYRGNKVAGSPGAMLSAGNLNTAALTLFLALHLSVEPRLPFLLLDDPVQSMDEVHVQQFAALLRTLSKRHGRRIILAVHDRALFEYLSLELSAAQPDDVLVTVELSRSRDEATVARPSRLAYVPDLALMAEPPGASLRSR